MNPLIRMIRQCLFAVLVAAFAASAGGQTPGSVTFTGTVNNYTGTSGSSHYTVVWVTKSDGTFIKTLWKQGPSSWTSSQWGAHCGTWNTARAGSDKLDGYSSATATSYTATNPSPPASGRASNPINVTWNCTGADDALVPDADYKFWVQYAEDSGQGPVTTGGMTWTKRSTPFSTTFAARGTTGSPANGNNFTSLSATWTPTVPEIAVEQPAGTNLTDGGAAVAFGAVNLGTTPAVRSFTVRNTGSAALTGLSITRNGTHAGDFTVGTLATSVAAGGSATFTVSFAPGAAGARTAAIHIASNDPDENPFDISLSGMGNALPVFSGYAFGSAKNTAATVATVKLLASASDPDGGTPVISGVVSSSAQGGSVALVPDAVRYTPPADFTGPDTFQVTIGDGQGGAVQGTVAVTVAAAPPGTGTGGQSANRMSLTVQPGGNVDLLFMGIPGQQYRIERSTDLNVWTLVATVTATPDGTIPWTDTNPDPAGNAFYRTAVVP